MNVLAKDGEYRARRRRPRFTLGWLIAGVLLSVLATLFAEGLLFEPYRLVPIWTTLPCGGLEQGNIRIALFSDVDFMAEDRRTEELRSAITAFEPDIVLVAGDFLNRISDPPDGERLRRAREYLASLPAGSGRYFVPGEDESDAMGLLREEWAGIVDVLSNESRFLEIRGERLNLFGAHSRVDRVPWSLGVEGGRGFVFSRGRPHVWQQRLVYAGEGANAWGDVEITMAFQALQRRAYLDLRFAWVEGAEPEGGRGWRLTRHEGRPDFKLTAGPGGNAPLKGRFESGFAPPSGQWCRLRVRMEDEGNRVRVRGRFWFEGEPEPRVWQIDAFDDSPERSRAGTIALGGRRGERRYADLRVVDARGRVLMDENFTDRRRFLQDWESGCELSGWLFEEKGGRAARVILAHEPDIAIEIADAGAGHICGVFAGHTHGGQVRLPGIGALYSATALGRRYDRGLFHFRGVPLYISAGIGTSVIPVRLFNPPEVSLITLVPSSPLRSGGLPPEKAGELLRDTKDGTRQDRLRGLQVYGRRTESGLEPDQTRILGARASKVEDSEPFLLE